MNERGRKMREWTEGMWWGELKRREGVWLVSALCWWMRIWGIVCRPICSSVGEVVRSQSQGWGPEGQERKVRAASRSEESGSMKKKNASRDGKQRSKKNVVFMAVSHSPEKFWHFESDWVPMIRNWKSCVLEGGCCMGQHSNGVLQVITHLKHNFLATVRLYISKLKASTG